MQTQEQIFKKEFTNLNPAQKEVVEQIY